LGKTKVAFLSKASSVFSTVGGGGGSILILSSVGWLGLRGSSFLNIFCVRKNPETIKIKSAIEINATFLILVFLGCFSSISSAIKFKNKFTLKLPNICI